jgi:hypothetical protein
MFSKQYDIADKIRSGLTKSDFQVLYLKYRGKRSAAQLREGQKVIA